MSIRTEKVASLLQQELGTIFQQEFSRIGPIITIVDVKVTTDLGLARVYVSIIGTPKEQVAIMTSLQTETKSVRKILSSRIRHHFRRIPKLEFYEDQLYVHATRIEQLLNGVRKSFDDIIEQ
ncbi:MAG: 30S ribosome-binding factor RbfA [Chlorobiaceae bacterium]